MRSRRPRARSMPVIGIGEDAAQAYAPWIVSVHGQRIAFLAATAFLVPRSLVPSWSAGPHRPGLAMAMPGHGEEGEHLTLEMCLEDLNQRDAYDSTREHSPLCQAKDAYVIDTSDLTIEEVVDSILEIKDSIKTDQNPPPPLSPT